jgi:hypothetical protein
MVNSHIISLGRRSLAQRNSDQGIVTARMEGNSDRAVAGLIGRRYNPDAPTIPTSAVKHALFRDFYWSSKRIDVLATTICRHSRTSVRFLHRTHCYAN